MSDETGRGGDMTFPVQEKTYLEVWESELSRFVSAYYNRPWSMQQGEMLGQNTYRELDVDPQGPEFNSALAAGDVKTKGTAVVTRAMHKSGRRLYVELSFSLLRDTSGAAVGAIAVARDVTDKRTASQQGKEQS